MLLFGMLLNNTSVINVFFVSIIPVENMQLLHQNGNAQWLNPLTAKLSNLNFHPLDVVSR